MDEEKINNYLKNCISELGDEAPQDILHYTSFEAFTGIVEGKKLWFGNSRDLNDPTELVQVKHAFLDALTHDDEFKNVFNILKSVDEELVLKFGDLVDKSFENDLSNTYIASFSVSSKERDLSQELMMWRGYAADGKGVSLRFSDSDFQNIQMIEKSTLGLNCSYGTMEDVRDFLLRHFAYVTKKVLEENKEYIRENRFYFALILTAIMTLASVRFKHRAYQLENEFRIVYLELLDQNLNSMVETKSINGKLVRKFCFPLQGECRSSKKPYNLLSSLKEVVVGPCNDQYMQFEAVKRLLKNNGLEHIPVVACDIPYRSTKN